MTWLDSPAAMGDRTYLNGMPIPDDEWKRFALLEQRIPNVFMPVDPAGDLLE